MSPHAIQRTVIISNELEGDLCVPSDAKAIVLFAHGNGSGRHSNRNGLVAKVLNNSGLATLLIDLLTSQEQSVDAKTRHLRFDIDLLARRFVTVTKWILQNPETSELKIGYFGSSTGAAAALVAAAELGDKVKAVVGRGGRPDLAESRNVFDRVSASVLLIVGGKDVPVIGFNRRVLKYFLNAPNKEFAVIPGAGHLFEEAGAMQIVSDLAAEWFECHLLPSAKRFDNKYGYEKTRPVFERPKLRLRFKDRVAAGEMLASRLGKYRSENDTVVIGIPRGGVVVAGRVADKIGAHLDIVVPRKLRAQENSERSIGAIIQGDSFFLDLGGTSHEYVESEKEEQTREMERRLALFRPGSEEYMIRGKLVILVDDGAATGATMLAAARWIRTQKPKKLVAAVPVASPQARRLLKDEVDDLEILRCPSNFENVEEFYNDFVPIGDKQVIEILQSAKPN